MPEVKPTEGSGGKAYDPVHASKPPLALKAAALSSPSAQSQRGKGFFSSNPEPRLARLPFHQGVTQAHLPGPGTYEPFYEDTIRKAIRDGEKEHQGRGLASTSFRSTTPQHVPHLTASQALVPPPGTYDTETAKNVTASNSGDMSRLIFASKTKRFTPHNVHGTSESIGPGSYDPMASIAKVQEDRLAGGKEGARSYPFSSTDRRYRTGKSGPGEHDIYVSSDGRVY